MAASLIPLAGTAAIAPSTRPTLVDPDRWSHHWRSAGPMPLALTAPGGPMLLAGDKRCGISKDLGPLREGGSAQGRDELDASPAHSEGVDESQGQARLRPHAAAGVGRR